MADFIDNTAGVTASTGTGAYVIGADTLTQYEPIIGNLTDGNEYAYKVTYVSGDAGYETGIGTWSASGATLTRDSISTSSNGGLAVDWQSGNKLVYIVANTTMLTRNDAPLATATAKLTNVTTVSSAAGSALSKTSNAAIRGTLGAAPIVGANSVAGVTVIMATGNSQCAGFNAGTTPPTGSPPVPLVTNTSVYIWQATTWDRQDATWQNADHAATPLNVPAGSRMVGYYGGQVGTQWLEMANRIQEQKGGIVLVIPTWMGGVPSDLYNPSMGDTDSLNNFNGDWSSNNNMWYWCCTAVNNALAAANAGTGLPAAYAVNYVDIAYCDISSGNAIYTSTYAGASRTMAQANSGFVTDMIAFINGAETGTTIGGWAKQWATRWYSSDVPAGTVAGGGLQEAFADFDGNARLFNECKSLLFTVPSPTGLISADNSVIGTSDSIHRNSIHQTTMGETAADMWLNIGQKGAKGSTAMGTAFSGNTDGGGFLLSNILTQWGPSVSSAGGTILPGRFSISGTHTLTASADVFGYVIGNTSNAIVRNQTAAAANLGSVIFGYDVTTYRADTTSVGFGGLGQLSFVSAPTFEGINGATLTVGNGQSFTSSPQVNTNVTFTSLKHFIAEIPYNGVFGGRTGSVVSEVGFASNLSSAINTNLTHLLLGGTTSVAGDFAIYQIDTLPTSLNGNLTIRSGSATLTSGNLGLTSGNVTLTNGDLTITSGEIIGNDLTFNGNIVLRPYVLDTAATLAIGAVFGGIAFTATNTATAGVMAFVNAHGNGSSTSFYFDTTTAQTAGQLLEIRTGTAVRVRFNYQGAPGFWGFTPVTTQPTAGSGVGGAFVAGGGTGATSLSTWTGNTGSTAYTVNDIVWALKKSGLIVT